MSGSGGAVGVTSKVNWRARFFWGAEMSYAVIGGAFEAYVYYAFTPRDAPDVISVSEALVRAVITQVMILLLGVAGVEIIRAPWHWFFKVWTFLFVQGVATLFAVVAFDLMRVAAIAFQRPELLGGAQDQGNLTLPFIGTITTIDLIAGLPFYQVAVNWVAHIVTKDRAEPTVEELEEAARRTEAANKLKVVQRAGQVGGWLATAKQLGSGIQELRGKGTGSTNLGQSDGQTSDNPLANLEDSGVQTLDIGSAPERAVPASPPKRGPWKSRGLLAYIALEYPQVTLSETLALDTIKTLGNGAKKGTAYVASMTACKAWARKTYGVPLSEQTPALVG